MNAERAGGMLDGGPVVCAADGAEVRAGRRAGSARRTPRIGHALRRAVAFAYYGLAGLVIGWILLPIQALAARFDAKAEPADLRAQRAVRRASMQLLRLAERLGLLRCHWEGLERLGRGPALLVVNHPSLIDTPLLASRFPQLDLIVSPEWSESFFFRRVTTAANYLRTDRGPAVVRDAARRLRAGRCVAIYPEGSRTPPDGLRPFHRGAAHVALEAGVDLLPIVIRVTPRTLMKGQPWYHEPERTPEWHVEVGEAIRPADYLDGSESRPVAARRLTAILQEHFEKRWSRGDG